MTLRLAVLLAMTAGPAFAQNLAVSALAVDTTLAVASVRAAAIIVESEPNAIRVVGIPLPAEVRNCQGQYEFVRHGAIGVLGTVRGNFGPIDRDRLIVVSINIPSAAPSGRTAVGVMRFQCDDGVRSVEVPVIVDVLPRYSLALNPARSLIGTHAGARVRTDVTIRNGGNAAEQITLMVELPNDWRSKLLEPMPLKLAAGAARTVQFEVLVPDNAGAGDYGAVVRATSATGTRGVTTFTVRVSGGQRGAAIGWRPALSTEVVYARDADGGTATAYGADLSGEFFPEIRANGRLSIVPRAENASSVAQRSLGRLGIGGSSSFLYVTAPHWEAGLGNIGYASPGLIGVGLWGVGATARAHGGDWRGSLAGIRPTAGIGQTGGHYIVAEGSRRVGAAWTGMQASDLQDTRRTSRTVRSLMGDVSVPWKSGLAQVQLGAVNGDAASGLAWLGRFEHRTTEWGLNVVAARAPGGAASFARTENEFNADAFRTLGDRVTLGVTYWNSSDGVSGVAGQRYRSSGWASGDRVMLGRFGTLNIDARVSQSEGTSSLGRFTNADRQLSGAWSGTVRRLQLRAGVSRGSVERGSELGGISAHTSAPRSTLFGSVGTQTRFGSVSVDLDQQRTGAGVGVPSEQTSLALRADRVPLMPRVFLYGEVLAYTLGATSATHSSQVIGVRAQIGETYELTVDAERNGFQRSRDGRIPWVLSTKLQHTFRLPALRGAALRGVVFADLDGNGVRGVDEDGVYGAVVHIDGDVVTTDSKGRFEIGRTNPNIVAVDPRSLPAGWVAAPQSAERQTASNYALGVVPTSRVEVTVTVVPGPGLDTTKIHLEDAIVVLSDSLGRKWNAAVNARGVIQFDALPPGLYEVSADLSRVGETLVLPEELPRVRVEGGGGVLKVELRVGPRPIRTIPQTIRGRQIGGRGTGDRLERD